MTDAYVPNRRISMKTDTTFTEQWLQKRLVDDPSLLGLGDLDVKDVERSQPRAGRLDLLLSDPESNTRYEVEIQLGSTDESHIIRTIEYWDLERRRYPQYEHVAVIVAEDITARFYNVISLFNGFIPIIAVQSQVIEVGKAVTLVCTRVLDWQPLGLEEEGEVDEPRDRAYWEHKAAPQTLAITDTLLGLIRDIEPHAALNYKKNYIGLAVDGVANNWVIFRPKRAHIVLELRIPRSEELSQKLEEAGMTELAYRARWGSYQVRLVAGDVERNTGLVLEMLTLARDSYGSPR